MANQLRRDTAQAIAAPHEHGWSNRRYAAEPGIHRTTGARHLAAKPTQVTVGPDGGSQAGGGRLHSLCEPFREVILEKLEAGLSGQRIHKDFHSTTNPCSPGRRCIGWFRS